MDRKTLTFGESNVAALAAFFGALGGTLILSAVALLIDIPTGGSFSSSDGYLLLTMVSTQFLMFAGAFFYLSVFRRVNYFKLFSFGFDKLDARKTGLLLLITVGCILLFVPFAELFVWALTLTGYKPIGGDISFGEGFGGILTVVFAAAVLPAVFEEALFRGVYLNGARKRGSFFAVVYSAFIFMIYHGNPVQTVHQFFLGIVLAYLAVVSGKIGYGIAVHFLNNFIAVLLSFVPFQELSAGWTAFMYVVWVLAGAIILIPSLKAFSRMSEKERNPAEERARAENGGFFATVVFDITSTFSKIFKLITKKGEIKKGIEAFNSRYDGINEFNGEIPDDVVFAFGKNEGKKLPVSAVLLIIGFAAMWLAALVMGFFNIY
ncbi:MAG: CPBP family intramembrane metalloprotease [Clostridiales bacterium]|jgi:membrane protease YdiL (CAAX protease family)|nr:CPBP family intramembrane metalloprotease [Clostridiales bacterium]